ARIATAIKPGPSPPATAPSVARSTLAATSINGSAPNLARAPAWSSREGRSTCSAVRHEAQLRGKWGLRQARLTANGRGVYTRIAAERGQRLREVRRRLPPRAARDGGGLERLLGPGQDVEDDLLGVGRGPLAGLGTEVRGRRSPPPDAQLPR